MKDRGFTLIELLAVIVILAIIALIATPIIIGIINDAKKESNERSAELYLKAAELAIARENLNGELNASSCDVQSDGNLKCNGKDVKVDVDGEKPKSGKITFSNGKIAKISNLNVSGKYINKTSTSSEMVISDTPEEESFTGTVYRNSTDTVTIGDSIIPQEKTVYCAILQGDDGGDSCDFGMSWDLKSECDDFVLDTGMTGTCETSSSTIGLSSYETEETKNNITQNSYLKHEVEDNIVTASYACIRYTGGEACVRGGNPSYYGGFDEMTEGMGSVSEVTNPQGNIAEIAKTRSYFLSNGGSCEFSDSSSSCRDSSLYFNTSDDGYVEAQFDRIECRVSADGSASCGLDA